MKKRIILSVVAVGIFFTTVSFKNDFFEIHLRKLFFFENTCAKTVDMCGVDQSEYNLVDPESVEV